MTQRLFAILVVLAGCGSPPTNPPIDTRDLGASDLLPAPDLTAPPDLAALTFCANTPVAGTCAQAFFQPIAACFAPSGACIVQSDQKTYVNFCWDNGAKLLATSDMVTSRGTWRSGAGVCMEGEVSQLQNGPVFALRAGGATLVYDNRTGDVTCPDGSKTHIGPNGGGCMALQQLLSPPVKCTAGTCS